MAAIPMEGVKPDLNILEGLCFDKDGSLLVCNTPMSRIWKVDVDTGDARLWLQLPDNMMPSAIKLHRDGNLYVTCAASDAGGLIAVLSPEGEIVDRLGVGCDHMIDDMVFDGEGGIYCTDLGGSIASPTSGVYYIAPGQKELVPVVEHMAATNGIAITPDWDALWITEYDTGLLHYLQLGSEPEGLLTVGGSHIAYHFTGLEGPDSACIDADGNLYVAMCGQGRFLVFNNNGMPIGQVLIPGRDEGRMLKSTHPQIMPGTNELYLCSADMETGDAAIYVAGAFGKAFPGFAFSK